jgi:hypothetical protein
MEPEMESSIEVKWVVRLKDEESAIRLALDLDWLAAQHIGELVGLELRVGDEVVRRSTGWGEFEES